MRINFLGLQAFLSVAERGSFRRAASHLNLSQTAVSHRMKKLEDELGLKLFARTTRELTLTKAGLELMAKAKQAVSELEGCLDGMRQQGTNKRGRISIACLPAFAIYRLPPVLTRFRALYPDMEVKILEGSSFEIAALLQNDEAEFGLSVVSTNRWDLDTEPLIEGDPMVLACPKDHPLAKRRYVEWKDLKGHELIRVGLNTSIRAQIDDALGTLKDDLNWRYEVQRVETAVNLVDKGCGITIVPRSNVILSGGQSLVSRPLRGPSVSCTFGLVTKRGVPLSPIAERFKALLREQLAHEMRKMK